MTITIPFFGRKARRPVHQAADTTIAGARKESAKLSPRRFRPFVRPAPTVFQRCLAAHIYLAQRLSALD